MKIKILGLLLAISLMPSCAMQRPIVERIPFPADEYAALSTAGTGVVSGQGFLKTTIGEVRTAAGSEVSLNPVTSYSQQWYDVGYLQNTGLGVKDSRYDEYIIRTVADGDGRFTFRNVPPGDYFLNTSIIWHVPRGYVLIPQGGYVCEKITVKNGDELNIILTR
jgi:hypothetical protein